MSFEIALTGRPFIYERYKCTVEAVLPIPKEEWDSFLQNDGEDDEWLPRILSGSLPSMYIDPQQMYHCVMLVGDGQNDGILCYTEGDGYVSSGYIPNGRLIANTSAYPSLQDFSNRMGQLANRFVDLALNKQKDGKYSFSAAQLRQRAGNLNLDETLFTQMMLERKEIRSLETDGEFYHVGIAPIFQKQDDRQQLRKLSTRELDILCAKHTLWLNDLGGEKADFSGCRIKGVNLSHRDLTGCCFDHAVLENVQLTGTNLQHASFCGAFLKDCLGERMLANHADFSEAKFMGGRYNESSMEYSNLMDALFNGCEMGEADLYKSCIENAIFVIPDAQSLDLDVAIPDWEEWQSSYAPKPDCEVEM